MAGMSHVAWSQSITEGSQDRNSRQEHEAEANREDCFLLTGLLASPPLAYTTRGREQTKSLVLAIKKLAMQGWKQSMFEKKMVLQHILDWKKLKGDPMETQWTLGINFKVHRA